MRQARERSPDVVLMDLSMPELNGADATRAILERDPRCRVIVLSMYAEREYVRRALKAGAAGYVVKRSAAKEVVEAIRAVYAGQRYLSPRVADVVIDDYAGDEQATIRSHAFRRASARCCSSSPRATPGRRSPSACRSRRRPSRPTARGWSRSSASATSPAWCKLRDPEGHRLVGLKFLSGLA